MKQCIARAIACALTLGLPAVAEANELADACGAYTRSSEMLKQAPADNRAKWCSCLGEKVPGPHQRSAAAVIKLQQEAETNGQALGEHSVPAPHKDGFKAYTDAQSACFPVLMGSGPPPTGGRTAPPAPTPGAYNADFSLVNRTGLAIDELYVSPPRSKNWGKDVLGDKAIEHGKSWKLKFPQSRSSCRQDIKVVFADNSEAIWENVNLCELTKIMLTYDRRTGTTTAETE